MRNLRFLFLPILIALQPPGAAWGQSVLPKADSTAAGLLAASLSAEARGRTDSADLFQSRAFEIFKRHDALGLLYDALFERGKALAVRLDRPVDAIKFVRKNSGSEWRKPRTPEEWKLKIRFTNVGAYAAQVRLGDYQTARAFYEQCFDDYSGHLGNDERELAYNILGQLANICSRLGDYERARLLLSKKITLALHNRDQPIAAEGYNDLAIAMSCVGRLDSAIALSRLALAQPEGERPFRLLYFNQLATLYLLKKDFAAAAKACREARTAFKNYTKESQKAAEGDLAELAENEAEMLAGLGRHAEARKKYELAIRLTIESCGDENRREVAKLRVRLGDEELAEKRPDAAMRTYQRALQNVVPGSAEKDPAYNPPPEQLYPENAIREALDGKARAWQMMAAAPKLAVEKKTAVAHLQKALDCYDLIDKLDQRLRETYQFESSSLQVLDEARARLERATGIAYQLFEATGDKQFVQKAFSFCEKSKGLLLIEGIVRARSDFKLPDELHLREQEISGRVARLELEILKIKADKNAPAAAAISRLEDDLLRSKQERQRFWDELKTLQPVYWKLSQAPANLAPEDVPKLLNADQLMVEYLVGEQFVYVFRATADGHFSMRKATLPPGFSADIDSLRAYLAGFDPDPMRQAHFMRIAHDLFKLLLGEEMAAPAFSSKKRLLVVPDGVLGFVPFEALLERLPAGFAPGPVAFAWATLDFLLKKKAVSYAWSASLLRMQLGREPVEGLKPFAAFVPDYSKPAPDDAPVPASRDDSGSLPGAKAEADRIEKLIGGRFFRGDAASRANFLHWAGQFRILHLAMHAVSDADEPALSRLIFSPEKGGRAGDNHLYLNDLQQIALRAELAVLSACNTGNGRLHRGEGVYSLARGFALAGVPATLMSLWRLDDGSAPAVMSVFYENLKKGQRKDDALAAAKLSWIGGGGAAAFKHPYFWAGVVANGNMAPISLDGCNCGRFCWCVALIVGLTALLGWISARHIFFRKPKSTFTPN